MPWLTHAFIVSSDRVVRAGFMHLQVPSIRVFTSHHLSDELLLMLTAGVENR